MTTIEALPDDVLGVIFKEFISFRKGWKHTWFVLKPWFTIMLVSKQFLRAGRKAFDPSVYHNIALRKACEKGYTNYVAYLLRDPRVNPAVDDSDPLKVACANNRVDIVHGRANPTAARSAAVSLAVSLNFPEVIQLFLADPRSDLPTIFSTSCRYGNLPIIQQLLEHPSISNPDVITKGFIEACSGNQPEALQMVFVESAGTLGFEAAIRWGSDKIVRKLLEKYKPTMKDFASAGMSVFPMLLETVPKEEIVVFFQLEEKTHISKKGKILRTMVKSGDYSHAKVTYYLENYPETDITYKNHKLLKYCINKAMNYTSEDILSFYKSPIGEADAQSILCNACSKRAVISDVIEALLKKVEVNTAVALYDAAAARRSDILRLLLSNEKTILSSDVIGVLQSDRNVWKLFGDTLKSMYPEVPNHAMQELDEWLQSN